MNVSSRQVLAFLAFLAVAGMRAWFLTKYVCGIGGGGEVLHNVIPTCTHLTLYMYSFDFVHKNKEFDDITFLPQQDEGTIGA